MIPRLDDGRAAADAGVRRDVQGNSRAIEDVGVDPPALFIDDLGVLAIAYHLANGLWSFAMGWGITASKRALAWAERIAIVVFIALLAVGWSAAYALWRTGA